MLAKIRKSLEINSGEIHIWSSAAAKDKHRLKEFSNFLSKDEVVRANKFRFEKDRSVYITAKYLLRNLLGNYLNLDPKELIFDYNEYDKPVYLNSADLNFNVSHSGNRIIIGFAKNLEIGADIEKIKADFDVLELAKNFFSKEEIKALTAMDENERFRAFYRCWTRKEAFIKAVGEGLSYPLDSFSVTMEDDLRAQFVKIDGIQESKMDWFLHSFVPEEGYISAFAINGTAQNIEFFNANEFID